MTRETPEAARAMNTVHAVTIPEMRAVLAPFVGAKLVRAESHEEYYARPAVDILYPGCEAMDADIRAIDDEGIERFFYSGAERIAWSDVHRITIRRGDSREVYWPIAAPMRSVA